MSGCGKERIGVVGALACALALVLGLAGCAQGQGSTSSTQPQASAASSASAEKPAPTAEIANVTTVAYLGPAGTYTEEAARLFFGGNDEMMPQATVADALALVAEGKAAYAVIPQENTLGGPVTDYIDAFLAADNVRVVGEVVLPIRQTLMGRAGTDLSKVTRVLSHKQGLAQSTAAAAREVAEGDDNTVVAIAAPGAANLYQLEVLQENVSQTEANKTRFYVVSKQANKLPGYECAVFAARTAADKLPGMLDASCPEGTKLAYVHDRPEKSALGMYRYVIELERENGFSDEEISRLEGIDGLEYLGRYSRIEG